MLRPGLTQFFVGVLLLGSPVGLWQFFCSRGGDRENVLLIARGKYIVCVLRWARAFFFGVRLSEFPFGLRRVVFV